MRQLSEIRDSGGCDMVRSWWRKLVEQIHPSRGRCPAAPRWRCRLEPLEDRLLLASSVFYSLPTNLLANRGTAVTVPVRIDHLSDSAGNQGLSGADVCLVFDPAVFFVADVEADVTPGALLTDPPANGAWNFNASATDGEVLLSASTSGPATDLIGSTGGVLAHVTLHVKAFAPTGRSTVRVATSANPAPDSGDFSSASAHNVDPGSGVNVAYSLEDADQVDGQITITNVIPSTTLSVATAVTSSPGSLTVAVSVSNPNPSGSAGLISADAALLFDPTLLSVASMGAVVAGAELPAEEWAVSYQVDASGNNGVDPARAALGLHLVNSSGGSLTTTSAVHLWLVTFSVLDGASGSTVLNLVPGAQLGGVTSTTNIAAANFEYQLAPPPTNAGTDAVDYVASLDNRLAVQSVTPTAAGFVVRFNKPFAANTATAPARIRLFNTEGDGLGPPSVVLAGGMHGRVRGSLTVDESANTVTFLATAGALPPDTYTVTVLGGMHGFRDPAGNPLASDHTSQFTVAAPPPVSVSLPTFARGPGQEVQVSASVRGVQPDNVKLDGDDHVNSSSNRLAGIPLQISNGANVQSIALALTFDAALLIVTGVQVGPGLADVATVVSDLTTAGQVSLTFSASAALQPGPQDFVTLLARVPTGASSRYGAGNLLHFAESPHLLLSGGGQAVVPGIDGLHVAAYPGDVSGGGGEYLATGVSPYEGAGAALMRRVAVGRDGGFAAHWLIDPVLVGDITGDGRVSSLDSYFLSQAAAGRPADDIPALPSRPSAAAAVAASTSGMTPAARPNPRGLVPMVLAPQGGTVSVESQASFLVPAGDECVAPAAAPADSSPQALGHAPPESHYLQLESMSALYIFNALPLEVWDAALGSLPDSTAPLSRREQVPYVFQDRTGRAWVGQLPRTPRQDGERPVRSGDPAHDRGSPGGRRLPDSRPVRDHEIDLAVFLARELPDQEPRVARSAAQPCSSLATRTPAAALQ